MVTVGCGEVGIGEGYEMPEGETGVQWGYVGRGGGRKEKGGREGRRCGRGAGIGACVSDQLDLHSGLSGSMREPLEP